MALGRHENTKFCTQNFAQGWAGNWNIFYLKALGRRANTKWAGIIYVNIFYLKWLWQGIKTPSFAHEIEICFRNNYVNIFYLKWLWEGMKTPSFAHEIGESALAGVGRNNICEYLLFEMALGRHENTKFCTRNWRICTGRGGQE